MLIKSHLFSGDYGNTYASNHNSSRPTNLLLTYFPCLKNNANSICKIRGMHAYILDQHIHMDIPYHNIFDSFNFMNLISSFSFLPFILL